MIILSQYFNAILARRINYDEKSSFHTHVKWSKNRKYGLNDFCCIGNFVVQINTLGAVKLYVIMAKVPRTLNRAF